MFAWTLTFGAVRCEAYSTQRRPVCAAERPSASTIPTWRVASPASVASTAARASGAVRPSRISRMPSKPCAISAKDCVATAPAPGSTQGTPAPTLNQRDWTATPS
jgi:hypothetical protein